MRIVGVAKGAKRALTTEMDSERVILICLLKCILNRKETMVFHDDIVYVNYPNCVSEQMYTLHTNNNVSFVPRYIYNRYI